MLLNLFTIAAQKTHYATAVSHYCYMQSEDLFFAFNPRVVPQMKVHLWYFHVQSKKQSFLLSFEIL